MPRATCSRECLRSLAKTAWSNFEVVSPQTAAASARPRSEALRPLRHSVHRIQARAPFNFSHKMNFAVQRSSGEHVVLFNDDLEVTTPDWLQAMLEVPHSNPRSAR